jgi:predicted secreted Zn-dependent protease
MFKFFQAKNARREEWGKFHPERITMSAKLDRGEPITEVTLTVGYTITLPAWSKASSLGKKGKAAWDAMMAALKKHEDTHADIFEDQVNKFGAAITSQTDLTNRKLSDLFKNFPAAVKSAQDGYDSRTAHGEKEGVFLPAPDKVKD